MEIFRSFGHFSAYCYVKENELSGIALGGEGDRRRNHRRNIVIDLFAVLCNDVNSGWVNLGKVVPIATQLHQNSRAQEKLGDSIHFP